MNAIVVFIAEFFNAVVELSKPIEDNEYMNSDDIRCNDD